MLNPLTYDCDDMALMLSTAPVDKRTGNRVLYSATWLANKPSMIGERNEDWVRRELDWFASGSNALADMEGPVPKAFQDCANDLGKVNSAYGHTLFNREALPYRHGFAQTLADRIVDTFLNEGKATRHATAIISDRDIHYLAQAGGMHDFICTNALNIMIDDEDKLNIIVQMRSMDAVWGYRADYSMWDYLMGWLLGSLAMVYPELKRGAITFQVANLHVYPRHFELLAEWSEKLQDEINSRLFRGMDPDARRQEAGL